MRWPLSKLEFNFEATGVGSVPFKDAEYACQIIFDNFPAIPFWPQLPKRSYLENMYVQYSQRLPGLVIDEAKRTIYIETSRVAGEIEEIYSKYLERDAEFFNTSEPYAKGFYEFLERLKGAPDTIKFVKGQITGPVSFALSITDQNKRPIIHDNDLFEVATKVLTMKARWQIRKMKRRFPNVIIFIDEPYLVSIGSGFVNIDIKGAFEKIGEVIKSIKEEGALCGIHCCGNTDWASLLKSGVDILNFDAYNFMKEFLLYSVEIKTFLKNGGTIAWGMVPTNPDAIAREKKDSLVEKWQKAKRQLYDKGIRVEEISSLITPSCGMGTLDEEAACDVLRLSKKLSLGLSR